MLCIFYFEWCANAGITAEMMEFALRAQLIFNR